MSNVTGMFGARFICGIGGRRSWRGVAALAWGLLSTTAVLAQTAPPTPGAVEESLRPGPAAPATKEVPVLEKMPAAPRETVPPDGTKIPVRRFTFEGNTVFSDEELRAVIADKEGVELTLEEIYAVADRLTTFYLDHGYSVALVLVPAQRVTDGSVRLEINEGRISKLHFEGNEHYHSDVLRRHLPRIESGAIMRFDDIERNLLLLNDLPGLLVRAVLVPGEEYGTSDIRLRVEETPWDARLTLDNHGPESVGEWRLSADAGFNNLTGRGDRLELGATVAEDNLLRQARIGWSRPVGYDGGRLALNYSRAEYDVGGDFAALDISGRSETARLRYTYPHLRSRNRNFYWSVGASHIRGRSVMEGIADPLTDGQVSLLEAGLQYGTRSQRGVHVAALQLSSNLQSNEPQDGGLVPDDGVPLRLNLSGSSERFLAGGWSLFGRSEVQLSVDPLPDSLQFGLGGPYSVRGFVASRQRGDQGVLASAEVRRYLQFDNAFITLRGFIDAGQINRKNPLAGQNSSDRLAGAGLGLSAIVHKRFTLDLAGAAPIDGDEDNDDSRRFWLVLGATF